MTAAGRVVVVGLGPAGPELVSPATLARITSGAPVFLRTARHPAASVASGAATFDAVYDGAATLEEVYATIAGRLLAAADDGGEVVYAVPGSPMVAERTVQLLLEGAVAAGVAIEVLPALSFLDLAWARLQVDPLAAGVRLVDGHRFAAEAADQRGPLLVAQCESRAVLSAIKLAIDDEPRRPVTVLHHLGLADERVFEVPWAEIDHEPLGADHLTSLYVPELAAPVGAELVGFADLVRTLRERCPWDREQTHHSLRRHAIEEVYEVVDAIDELEGGGDEAVGHLEEELGDLLFQVYFHATIAAEEGWFTLADVARGIHDKLVRRHPHVFGGEAADWEELKRAEKGRASVMDGLPSALPALMLAAKVGKKAATVGFEWPDVAGALEKLDEELGELRTAMAASGSPADDEDVADELGDVLFSVVNVARHLGQDPEAALRAAVAKFERRFRAVERLAAARSVELTALDLPAVDSLWDEAKEREAQPPTPR